jgi:peroxiredoxin
MRRIDVVAALLLALALSASSPARARVTQGQRAEDFELKDAAGKTVKLSALRGRVVLLDFWASWCVPCKKELPVLAEMAKRLHQRGIEILAVNVDKKRENAETFLRAQGVTMNVLFDPEGAVIDRYEPPKMPSSFVIDKKGLVRYVNASYEPGDEKKLEQQLLEVAGK